jgi:lipopolysaccharide exporter
MQIPTIKGAPYHKHDFPERLSKKVVRGGLWLFVLRITNRGLGFIRTIILARLLAPEDFGLLGVAMLAASTLDALSHTGFQSALIQKSENVKSYLDVAWTISVVRGVVLFFILVFSAPLIAEFFNSPQAKLVIMVIAVNMLLSGCGNIGVIFFQKELKFNKQFIFELSATLVDVAVSIGLAVILKNVWALIWGGIAKNIVRLLLSYILHPYRPRIKFQKEKFRDLFGFGIWVSGSTILIFLITQGDDIFVGKMLGVAALGFYQMAYLVSNLPVTEVADVVSRVTYPAYCKLQHDLRKVGEVYLKVLQLTAYVSVPLAAGIFILGPEFTRIFLGEKWMPMVPAMQVLAIAGLVGSIVATTKPIFYGIGKPKVDTIWQIVRLLMLCGLIYPLSVRMGIAGVAIATFISSFFSAIGFNLMMIRLLGCSFRSFGKLTILPLINAVIMVVVIMILKTRFSFIDAWGFIFLVGVGIATYLLITCLFEMRVNYGIRKILKEILSFI